MIFIELAKSKWSKCIRCKKQIKKGLPRLVTHSGTFVCDCCAEGYLDDAINILRGVKRGLKKLIKEHSQEIVMERLK